MSNLLDKASIILTPTAYNNGEALCVKPSDGSGDFDFSRNSAATRVNAQGLVENVQILSSNLVQNGDFSEEGAEEVSNGSFSQEGVQLVTNGDFSNGLNNWSVVGGSYASVNNGILNSNNTVNGSWFGQYIAQDVSFVNGKTYKITFKAKNISGNLNLRLTQGANVIVNYNLTSEFVSYTYYYTSNADNGSLRMFCNDAVGQFEIDNVSVREVGQDWDLGTGWSIAEDKAIGTSATGVLYTNITITSSNQARIKADVNISGGGIQLRVGGVSLGYFYGNIDYVFTSNGNGLVEFVGQSFTGSITNISVKEVGQNWTLGTGWSIGEDKVIKTSGNGSNLSQSVPTTTIGKTYKLTFDAIVTSGGANATLYGITIPTFSTSGSKEHFITATSTNEFSFFANSLFNGSITNISVIEITTDTSLPRINYEGFSYQDALGSELVVNGGFDDGSANWTLGSSWSVNNGLAYTDGSAQNFISQNVGLITGKKYNLSFDISNRVGTDGCAVIFGGNTFSGNAFANGTQTFQAVANGGIELRIYGFNGNTYNLDNVSVKEYLGQEVVPDSGCGSWLFEPQSTNLVTDSQNYNSTYWGGQRGTLSDGGVGLFYLSPTSNVIKYEVTTTGFNQLYYRLPSAVTIGNTYTQQGYVKCDDAPYIIFQIQPLTGNPSIVWDNINNVVISSDPSIDSFNITSLNGWVKAEITYTATVASIYASLKTYFSTTTSITQGVPIGTIAYQTFVQVEQQSYATSYIPTEGSTVTRNQDVCINASIPALSGSHTVYADYKNYSFISGGTNRDWQDGTNKVYLIYNYGGGLDVYNGSAFIVDRSTLIPATNFKIAIVTTPTTVKVFINGVNRTKNNALPNLLPITKWSNETSPARKVSQGLNSLVFFNEALSDQELTELTTI